MDVVNDILDYSKLEAVKVALEKIAFHPSEVAKEVCFSLKMKAVE